MREAGGKAVVRVRVVHRLGVDDDVLVMLRCYYLASPGRGIKGKRA